MSFSGFKNLLKRSKDKHEKDQKRGDISKSHKDKDTERHDTRFIGPEADLLATLTFTEGVRALKMPHGYTPHNGGFIEIPVRFALLAIELLHRGKNTPGLFRIPGNPDTLAKLHRYYDSIHDSAPSTGPIKQTLVPAPNGEGPSLIARSIHDTATVFKRYVGAVDGGILGDEATFDALRRALVVRAAREPTTTTTTDDVSDFAMDVCAAARALLALWKANWRRFNFACAVLGTLAALRQGAGAEEARCELQPVVASPPSSPGEGQPLKGRSRSKSIGSSSARSLARRISTLSLKASGSGSGSSKKESTSSPPPPAPTLEREKLSAAALGAIFSPLLLSDKLVPPARQHDAEWIKQRSRESACIVRNLVGQWEDVVIEIRALVAAEEEDAGILL